MRARRGESLLYTHIESVIHRGGATAKSKKKKNGKEKERDLEITHWCACIATVRLHGLVTTTAIAVISLHRVCSHKDAAAAAV